ncbi:MAG: hypothetical protein D6797_04250 [Bdellovibrio sp.]|nr:MAG: hypothetical protein D6797_04250 [Bdellovibrio sp.]
METLKNFLQAQGKNFWMTLVLFLLIFTISAYYQTQRSSHSPRHTDVTTYIPKGFVLVPIEIKNHVAFEALFGSFGIGNIYSANPHQKGAQILARSVRILRSPLNSQVFGVLLPEEEVKPFLKAGPSYWVVLKNKKDLHPSQPKSRVIYQ